MQTFVSDISHKTYPIADKVTGKAIRQCVLDEIKRDRPEFGDSNNIWPEDTNK